MQIQNMASVAGNLCNASPAADGVPPLMILDAEVELRSAAGTSACFRSAQFILGNRRTALQPGEMRDRDPHSQGSAAGARLRKARRAALSRHLDRHGRRAASSSAGDGDHRGRCRRGRLLLGGGACGLPALEAALIGAARRRGRWQAAVDGGQPRRRSRRSTTCAARRTIAARRRARSCCAPSRRAARAPVRARAAA